MTDINHLIHLNIEIEGLLRVLLDRDSMHARSALAKKYAEYANLIEELIDNKTIENPVAVAEMEDTAAKLAAEATHVEVKDQEAIESEQIDETDLATEAIEQGQRENAADSYPVIPTTEYKEPAPDTLQESASEHTEIPAQSAPMAPRTSPNTKLLKAFTINDRFRFRRELFGGNDSDFSETLHLLADMDSYAEAEDYLYNDLMWDSANPAVADFMEILEQNM